MVSGAPWGGIWHPELPPKLVDIPSSVNAGRACGYALLTVFLVGCASSYATPRAEDPNCAKVICILRALRTENTCLKMISLEIRC